MATEKASIAFGEDFARALQAVTAWHGEQGREGSRLPYLGHLLAVCSIVIEAGADEKTAIAALLHSNWIAPRPVGVVAAEESVAHKCGRSLISRS